MNRPPRSLRARLGLLAVLGLAGCSYQPASALLWPQEDGSLPWPDQGQPGPDAGDAFIPDPASFALYNRQCATCHPDFGRRASDFGPELAGVLTHHGRATTAAISRNGGGEMVSLADAVTAEQADALVAMLAALHGEGFEPPATGDPTRGRTLFDADCAPCHLDGGASEQAIPEIASSASLLSPAFLDQLYDQGLGTMPAVTLTPAERSGVQRHLTALAASQEPAATDRAAFDRACGDCHPEGGRGKMRVPVVQPGGYLSPAALRTLCVEGQGQMPGVLAALSDAQALDLQAYLRAVEPSRALPGEWPPLPLLPATPGAALRGRTVWEQQCRACHGERGGPPLVWPHLRDAGHLHSQLYLEQFIRSGGGAMPAYPELSDGQVRSLAQYLEQLSVELRDGGPATPADTLFTARCEACHADGGRRAVIVSTLGQVGQDLSVGRLRQVLEQGLGAMPAVPLTGSALTDLVLWFQEGLTPPATSAGAQAAARQSFAGWCESCHLDGGLAPTQVPGLGSVMGRASSAFLATVVNQGFGWMPPIPTDPAQLAAIDEALRQAAANQPLPAAGQLAYDTLCRSCHLGPELKDAAGAAARPTVVTTVGGRLSPAFVDGLLGGFGAMPAVLGASDLSLRPYFELVAGGELHAATALPPASDVTLARPAFDSLCGSCHFDGGRARAVLPPLGQKLRGASTGYVQAFIKSSNLYGNMAKIELGEGELLILRGLQDKLRAEQAPSADQLAVYDRRCAHCHPLDPAASGPVVPSLVATGGRLSALWVTQVGQLGIGEMVPAYTPRGALPTTAELAVLFPQLVAVAGQPELAPAERPLDAGLVAQGKAKYHAVGCDYHGCHVPGEPLSLAPQSLGGRPYWPLAGLSEALLRQLVLRGMSLDSVVVMNGYRLTDFRTPEDPQGEAGLAAVIEYLLALGRGQTP